MKLFKKILLVGASAGLGALALGALKRKMTTAENDKLVDEFYEQESVKYVMHKADEKSQELIDDLASEANDHLSEMQKELDDMMTDYFKRQEKHLKKFRDICSGKQD